MSRRKPPTESARLTAFADETLAFMVEMARRHGYSNDEVVETISMMRFLVDDDNRKFHQAKAQA